MANLPNLPTLTTGDSTSPATALPTLDGSPTTGRTSQTSDATNSQTSSSSGTSSSSSSSSASSTSGNVPTLTSTGGPSAVLSLSNLPTLAGAGIPVLEIPFTAAAPFMQKSDLPEGTVFIAVGAVLAFLGACVLLWRGLIAWSINRSVRRAALASIGGSEKASSYWAGTHKNGTYTEIAGSNMSLDHLASSGKPTKHNFRDDTHRDSSGPAGLFFSPTAQATGGNNMGSRNSSYLPAGYYASPSSHVGGGAGITTVGGSLAPYARHSTVNPSPPDSPNLGPNSRGSAYRATSRDGLKPNNRDSHDHSRRAHSSGYHNQTNRSSMMTGVQASEIPGQRAPSAYLEDLFENHGNGPRERF